MLNLWENPHYSVEERLTFAQIEIQRYQNNIKKIYNKLEEDKERLKIYQPYMDDTTLEWLESEINTLEKVLFTIKNTN